ncbi:MAG: NHL repeat-containing protein [Solirubrobacteraceae bacterium]
MAKVATPIMVGLVALAFSSAPAFATTGYALVKSFDTGQGGQVGVAVDNSTSGADLSKGDVYVTDGTVVNKFTAAQAAAGESTPASQMTGFTFAWGVAVDPANGDIYVADIFGSVHKFSSSGAPESFSLSGVSFERPQGIAVNPSTGNLYIGSANTVYEFTAAGKYTNRTYVVPGGVNAVAVDSSGDVYVATGSATVKFDAACVSPCESPQTIDSGTSNGVAIDPANEDVFVSDGQYIVQYDSAGIQVGQKFGQGHLIETYGVAVNSAGVGYVADNPAGDADVFESGPLPETPVTGTPTGVTSTTAVFEGMLMAGNGTEYYFQYNTNGSCEGGATTTPGKASSGKVSSAATSLQPNANYTVCLVATGTYGQTVGSSIPFTTPAVPPTIDGEGSSSVTPFAATLEAFVNPQNQPTSSCVFEYGTTTAYGTSAPCEPASLEGYGDQRVSFALSGLKAGTTYHYRVLVKNATGTTEGIDTELTTLPAEKPTVDSENASGVTPTSVTLEANVNPNYQETTCEFQYGTSNMLTTSTTISCEQAGLGSGFGDQLASAHLENLVSGETYYYRVVAKNATGATEGAIQSFTMIGRPLVSTGETQNPTRGTAVLSGTVDPVGAPTIYHFVYIDEAGYEAAVASGAQNPYAQGGSTAFVNAGGGYATQPISSLAGGLLPVTSYHYALLASNSQGIAIGADKTFTTAALTPAILTTGPANGVSQNTATLSGTVNTQGLQTIYGFEIGTEIGVYGKPTGLGSVGAGANEANATLHLTGLQPGTTYHYRITAINLDGTSYGQDQTLTTLTFPNVLVTPPAPLQFVVVPPIAFPTETTTNTTIVKKKAKKTTKHVKKPKRKAKRKTHPTSPGK